MKRALWGALCGAAVGATLAIPIWWAISLVQAAEMKWLHDVDVSISFHIAQLLHLVVSTACFGATIGSILGATSAILKALKESHAPEPE